MASALPKRPKPIVALERPRFGEFARHVAPITTDQVSEALTHQKELGGRLGDILVERSLIAPVQINEILALQARWVAKSLSHDVPQGLPYPAFLSLCMPAYNEEQNIESVLDSACAILPEFVRDWEVLVVNDGSKDRTGEILRAYSQREPRVRVVEHPKNRGYGAAVSTGLRSARGDLVGFTDGDGQFSMLDLPQLLAQMGNSDVVIGYRHQRAEAGLRKLNAWSWNQLIRLVLGVRVRDLDCAFKLFRRGVVERLRLTSTGACINAEILVQCQRGNIKLSEIPITHHPRYHGAPTGANLRVIMKAFRELPKLWRYRREAAQIAEPVPAVTGQQTAA